jgi:hypothetical protein
MAEEIMYLKTFLAYRDYRSRWLLTDSEFKQMKKIIPSFSLQGQPFDEFTMLYLLLINQKPIIHRISQEKAVFSLGVRYNENQFIKIFGNMDLLE